MSQPPSWLYSHVHDERCSEGCGAHNIAVRRRYLNLFRGIIPPLGGTIDLSPILAFIVLDVRDSACDPFVVLHLIACS